MADETPTTEKRGARHSGADMAHLADIHGHATAIQAAALALGHEVPEMVQTIKAGDVEDAADMPVIWGVIKAAGDWELDVLANPYGGPHNGKDADGEFFSPNTQFHPERIPLPPAVYYHGHDKDPRTGKAVPTGMPEFIGRTVKRWVDARGVWYRVALDRASTFAKRVWEAAQRGTARASSGVVLATHRVDKQTGELLSWLNGEISIFETDTGKRPANTYAVAMPALKAVFEQAGLELPNFPDDTPPETDATGALGPVAVARTSHPSKTATEKTDMDENEILALLDKREAQRKAAEEAEAARKAAEDERMAAVIKATEEKMRKEYTAGGRLPMGEAAPAQTQFANTNKYDGLAEVDAAFLAGVLHAAKLKDRAHPGVSASLMQAVAIKMAEAKDALGDQSRATLKAAGIDPEQVLSGKAMKADEINYSTLASGGDDWIGQEYSRRLWEAVRLGTFVLDGMPTVVVPEGTESIILPVESTDPTWYKVAQAADENGTTKRPDATVTSSKLATTSKTLSVAKMGARSQFTGELVEDSLIPWAAQLRKQLEMSGAEILEHLVIDGDTDATNSTNINDIDGTPGATEVFLVMNGFRKLALVTNTANSRSANGSLVDNDYLKTVKLMGTAGMNAIDRSKVKLVVDLNTYWKSLELASVKTKDVFEHATLEGDDLTRVWGFSVRPSANMHRESAKRMAETTGKIDQTDGDNTTGAIVAYRPDQWLFGYKRRMTIKLQEFIDADVTQIVALCRVGMVNRDNEASAITYNVGVA